MNRNKPRRPTAAQRRCVAQIAIDPDTARALFRQLQKGKI